MCDGCREDWIPPADWDPSRPLPPVEERPCSLSRGPFCEVGSRAVRPEGACAIPGPALPGEAEAVLDTFLSTPASIAVSPGGGILGLEFAVSPGRIADDLGYDTRASFWMLFAHLVGARVAFLREEAE